MLTYAQSAFSMHGFKNLSKRGFVVFEAYNSKFLLLTETLLYSSMLLEMQCATWKHTYEAGAQEKEG